MSSVACVLSCSGIWIGGKGWGLSWKLIQCVVKPRVIQSVYGTCHIKLSNEDRNLLESQVITEEDNEDVVPVDTKPKPKIISTINTQVEDSDDETEVVIKAEPVIASPEPEKIPLPEPVPVLETTPIIADEVQTKAPVAPLPVKKIIKKKVV